MTHQVKHTDQYDFETLYTGLRQKEGRMYTDAELIQLPAIDPLHPHYKEWLIRKESCRKLIEYLKKKKTELSILEIGCGNGWLSHRLAEIPLSKVTGIDINFTEIQQAARVFRDIPNLHFIYSHAETGIFENAQFDIILFAASIQYFSSLPGTVKNTLPLLKPGGEVHIIDSHFYSLPDISSARQRSELYYKSLGFPELANWYFHHHLDELQSYNYSLLYDPTTLLNRFLKNKHPFHWIRITH